MASARKMAAAAETKMESKRKPKDLKPKPPFRGPQQSAPGLEAKLFPKPQFAGANYRAANKLLDRRALISGGDSGIGRSVAVLYAREGADVAIIHLPIERRDALETKRLVEEHGRRCLLIAGNLTDPKFCLRAVKTMVREFGGIDILVSNAAHQKSKDSIEEITTHEWEKTIKTNIEPYFHLAKFAIPLMKPGSAIIATSSETAIFGNKKMLDYSSTKGAIEAFTRSLAQNLIEKGIRVNAVAPGPVWTPLNPSDEGASAKRVREFGKDTPYGRPAQPDEIAPAYVFLASTADSSYITGIVLPILGGETVH